ncbi:LSM domain-containing protein [Plasmodiophora brassicae]
MKGSAFARMPAVAATNPRAWAVFEGERVSGVFNAKTIHECDHLIQYCYVQDRFHPTSSRSTNRSDKFILVDRQADPDALAEAFIRYEKGRLENERALYMEMWRLTGIGVRRGATELTRGLEKHFGLTLTKTATAAKSVPGWPKGA